jgi:quinol monooxygenase YgiN
MATILAHITVKPGEEQRFEALARSLYADTHAHETQVLRYEYWRGADPGSYFTLLSFADAAAFWAHQVSDHHEEAAAALGEVLASIRLEWVDPLHGASPLPSTTAQDVGVDADEATRRAARLFAPRIAAWWSEQS